MRFPYVSRLRLEFAEKEVARLTAQVEQLTDANDKLLEVVQLGTEIRKERQQQAEEEEKESSTRPTRVMGSDISRRATQAAARKAREEGRVK